MTASARAAVLGAALLLAGCWAEQPVGGVDAAVHDPALAGYWCFPEDGRGPDETAYLVARFNGNEYVAGPVGDFRANEALRLLVTVAGDQHVLNAQTLEGEPAGRRWEFARYAHVSADEATLQAPAPDVVPHDATSAALATLFADPAWQQSAYRTPPIRVRKVRDPGECRG